MKLMDIIVLRLLPLALIFYLMYDITSYYNNEDNYKHIVREDLYDSLEYVEFSKEEKGYLYFINDELGVTLKTLKSKLKYKFLDLDGKYEVNMKLIGHPWEEFVKLDEISIYHDNEKITLSVEGK